MNINPLPSVSTLTEQVYRILREQMLDQRLKPGERVSIEDLCASLGVSATPVRDALTQLSTEGLVQIIPRRGTFVTALSEKELRDLFEIRLMIELHAVDCAIKNATSHDDEHLRNLLERVKTHVVGDQFDDFRAYLEDDYELHSYCVRLCGNERLFRLFQEVKTNLQVARASAGRAVGDATATNCEHEEIVAAFIGRDPERLTAALRCNLENRVAYLFEVFGESLAEDPPLYLTPGT